MTARTLCAVAISFAIAMMPAAASAAAEHNGDLLVSYDGVTYSSAEELFPGIGAVVPGTVAERDLWLKNDSGNDGVLRVDMYETTATDLDLATAITVQIGDANPVSVSDAIDAGACIVVLNDVTLQPGQVVYLPTELVVDPDLGSAEGQRGDEGQNATAHFRLRAVITEPAAASSLSVGDACDATRQPSVAPSASEPTQGDSAALPATGSALSTVLPIAGLAAATAGMVMLATRNRSRPRD